MKYILYVGYPGYPNGLAQVQRQHLISKGLTNLNCNVLVLSRYGVHLQKNESQVNAKGNFEGISYKYCSGTPFRSDSFTLRNLLKVKGFFYELFTIIQCKIKRRADAMIITSNSFSGILYYTLLGKILHITTIVDQVEYWTSHKKGIKKKIDSYLNNSFYYYFPDKVIVISDFLKSNIIKNKQKKQILKVPALCDYEKFIINKTINTFKSRPYFLYCGSTAYKEVIFFIIDAYSPLCKDIDLILVVSGNNNDLEEINNYIKTKDINDIIIKSNIPYQELINYYTNSLALLIPLRPTLQDIARFPHKLGEYTASAKPIISTNIGEIRNYFKDSINSYLCDSYDIKEFRKKMVQVLINKQESDIIGIQSLKTGKMHFDYKSNAKDIYNFIFK